MKLRYTRRALRHLESIRVYLLERDAAASARVMGRVAAVMELLTAFPRMGHETAVPGTRVMVVAGLPYIVAYAIAAEADELVVLGVFHAAQDTKP